MKWIRRLFFNSKDDKLTNALKRIELLEAEQKMFRAGMSNLQSALIAITTNQETVAHDVHRIQEAIHEMLEGIQYQMMHGPDDKGWH